MPQVFDFGGRDVDRTETVASLRALKGTGRRAVQVTADTADEAAAAEAAGIDMVVCRAANVAAVRRGSTRVFVTAALGFGNAIHGGPSAPDGVGRRPWSSITATSAPSGPFQDHSTRLRSPGPAPAA